MRDADYREALNVRVFAACCCMEQGKQQYVSAFNVQIIIVVMATSFRSFARVFLKNDIPHIFEMLICVFENPSLPVRGLKREFERKYVIYND